MTTTLSFRAWQLPAYYDVSCYILGRYSSSAWRSETGPGWVVSHPCGSSTDPSPKKVFSRHVRKSQQFSHFGTAYIITAKEVGVRQGILTLTPLHLSDTAYPHLTLYRYSECEMSVLVFEGDPLRPPLWSSGQSSCPQIQRSGFGTISSRSGTGPTQRRE
jgi:hypothetical protein